MPKDSPHASRAQGRELALGVLCHLESYPQAERAEAATLVLDDPPRGDEEGEDVFARLCAEKHARKFAEHLLERVFAHAAEVDALISETSKRWRLERMDRVDRNVIRIAATELLASPDTPRGVVVSEAVRLASRYGSGRSVAFVNGVVESLAAHLRPKEAAS